MNTSGGICGLREFFCGPFLVQGSHTGSLAGRSQAEEASFIPLAEGEVSAAKGGGQPQMLLPGGGSVGVHDMSVSSRKEPTKAWGGFPCQSSGDSIEK